jgi:hypothetical protein
VTGEILHDILNPPSEPGPPYTHTLGPLAPDPAEAVAWLREQIESDRAAAPWRPWALRHDVIADCEAKLALLDTVAEKVAACDGPDTIYIDECVARELVGILASGYQHRDGYATHWGTPPTHTITQR